MKLKSEFEGGHPRSFLSYEAKQASNIFIDWIKATNGQLDENFYVCYEERAKQKIVSFDLRKSSNTHAVGYVQLSDSGLKLKTSRGITRKSFDEMNEFTKKIEDVLGMRL